MFLAEPCTVSMQEITNRKNDNETWKTISSQVMLVHVNTSQALKVSEQPRAAQTTDSSDLANDN